MASAGAIFSPILQERTSSNSIKTSLPPPFHSKPHYLHQLRQFLCALRSIDPNDAHFDRCKKALRIFTRVHEVLASELTTDASQRPEIPDLAGFQAAPDVGPGTVSDSASTDYFTEGGLKENLGVFGTLPWLDDAWMDFGGDDAITMSEWTYTAPVPNYLGMGDQDAFLRGS